MLKSSRKSFFPLHTSVKASSAGKDEIFLSLCLMLLKDYEVKQFGLTQQHVLGVSLLSFLHCFTFLLRTRVLFRGTFSGHFMCTCKPFTHKFPVQSFYGPINCLHGDFLACPTQRTLSERPEINVERKVKQIFTTPLVY